ncbi:hypothetical protein DFH06DRAFT_1483256 [Mycena polygramma]|nr:hypothetical protein DFH06DRAFT_1483632 [Mycena polygramma]KAJ7618858.1 hypothetical protein DFH06DRAFT_1483256 [Mycena polygramma]
MHFLKSIILTVLAIAVSATASAILRESRDTECRRKGEFCISDTCCSHKCVFHTIYGECE